MGGELSKFQGMLFGPITLEEGAFQLLTVQFKALQQIIADLFINLPKFNVK